MSAIKGKKLQSRLFCHLQMLSIWTSLKFCHLVKSKAKLIQIERICKRQLKGGSNDKICSEILSRNMAKNGENASF